MAQIKTVKKVSTFLSLSWRDGAKGLAVAMSTAVLDAVYTRLNTGALDLSGTTLHELIRLGALAGLGYLLKNFVSGPVPLKKG